MDEMMKIMNLAASALKSIREPRAHLVPDEVVFEIFLAACHDNSLTLDKPLSAPEQAFLIALIRKVAFRHRLN